MNDRSPRTTNPPSTRLFIGNVDYQISEAELKIALSQNLGLQPIDLHVAVDRETGKGKGFAFATFKNMDEAQQALSLLNGFHLQNRLLRADYATERVNSNPRPGNKPKHGAADHRFRQPQVSERQSRGAGPSRTSEYESTWKESEDGRNRRRR